MDVHILHNECCYFFLAANINQHASRAIYSRFAKTVSIIFCSHIPKISFATRNAKCHGTSATYKEKHGHDASGTKKIQSGVLAATERERERECRMGAKREQQ